MESLSLDVFDDAAVAIVLVLVAVLIGCRETHHWLPLFEQG